MGMTYDEARRCGLAHLWPTGGKSAIPAIVPPAVSAAPKDGMNKLERAFWQRAREAFPDSIYREPFKLRLAGRCWYTIDFLIAGHYFHDCYEIKGFMRDDAAVKLKVAAGMYPCFRWTLVTRGNKGAWHCQEVDRNGISLNSYTPDWLR